MCGIDSGGAVPEKTEEIEDRSTRFPGSYSEIKQKMQWDPKKKN